MVFLNNQELLKRYPRLVGHLIAESLGYFSVPMAIDAIRAHKDNRDWCCEWYYDIYTKTHKSYYQINKDIIKAAIKNRHYHKGAMASYKAAKALVMRTLGGGEVPTLASWF